MNDLNCRRLISVGITALLLTGCAWRAAGDYAPSAGTAAPSAQSAANDPKADVLLYVASGAPGKVHVFDEHGKSRGELKLIGAQRKASPRGLCADASGNVFVTGGDKIAKYAHGAKEPTDIITEPGEQPAGCSFDAKTGSLVVANPCTLNSDDQCYGPPGNVAIFKPGSKTPVVYVDPNIKRPFSATLDNQGNLFVVGARSGYDGTQLDELPVGSGSFTQVALPFTARGNVLWHDGHLILIDAYDTIYSVKVTGTTGTVISETALDDVKKEFFSFAILGQSLITPSGTAIQHCFRFWDYPAGGPPIRSVCGFLKDLEQVTQVTFSVTPT